MTFVLVHFDVDLVRGRPVQSTNRTSRVATKGRPKYKNKMKVSLFVTCLVDQLWTSVGVSSVEVLRRVGCEVEFDKRQTCCAQPAFNTGYLDEARQLPGVL